MWHLRRNEIETAQAEEKSGKEIARMISDDVMRKVATRNLFIRGNNVFIGGNDVDSYGVRVMQ